MSAEVIEPIEADNGLPPPSGLIAELDGSWDDPAVKPPKVAYSDNPGFTKGTSEHDYPVTAETSMFAIVGPENGLVSSGAVVEGLESAYFLSLHPAEAKAKRLERPIDEKLAFTGLQWLKEQALGKKDSQLRRNINRAHARLKGQQEVRAIQAQTGESYAKASRRLSEQEPQIAVSGVQSELARHKEQQAAYRSEFEQTVTAKIEGFVPKGSSRPLDPTTFFDLSKDLVISESDEGVATNEGNRSYQARIAKRVQQYMLDPQEILNDLMIAKLVDSEAGGGNKTASKSAPLAYINRIMCDVLELMLKGSYTAAELSPEVIKRWTDLAYRLDTDMTPDKLEKESKTDIDTWALVTVMSTGCEVMSASMQKIAGEQPKKFVDSLYVIAEAGLDHEHPIKTHTAIRMIEMSMDPRVQPLGEHILSTASGAIDDVELRQKALDLQVVLFDLGVPGGMLGIEASVGTPGDTVSMTTLTRAQSKVINKLKPSAMVRPPGMDQEAFQANLVSSYHRFLKEFWDYARTPEGSVNTLTGRLLSHRQRTISPIVRSMPEDNLPTLIRALDP